jgi:SAM-dependent methyltransferase
MDYLINIKPIVRDSMSDELRKSNVRHETFKVLTSDSQEETDAFVEAHIPVVEYEKKLTQAENVVDWIDDPTQISLIQPNLSTLVSHLQLMQSPWNILDIGCYAGYVYDYLAKCLCVGVNDFSYLGIDIREEAITGARAHHAGALNAEFRQVDLFSLANTFRKKEFNVCFSSRVLVHLPRFEEAMRNILHCSKLHSFIVIPLAKEGRCELRRKIFLDSGFEMPYVYRYFSEPMISAVAKANQQTYNIFNGSSAYATIHFKRKRCFWPLTMLTDR